MDGGQSLLLQGLDPLHQSGAILADDHRQVEVSGLLHSMEGEELPLDLQRQLCDRSPGRILLRKGKLGRYFSPRPDRYQRADVGLCHLYPGGGVGRILAGSDALSDGDGGGVVAGHQVVGEDEALGEAIVPQILGPVVDPQLSVIEGAGE